MWSQLGKTQTLNPKQLFLPAQKGKATKRCALKSKPPKTLNCRTPQTQSIQTLNPHGGFRNLWAPVPGPCSRDSAILRSILGSPMLGNSRVTRIGKLLVARATTCQASLSNLNLGPCRVPGPLYKVLSFPTQTGNPKNL